MFAPTTCNPAAPPPGGDARGRRSGHGALERAAVFIADWKRIVYIHFALPPAALAPHVPHPLDVVDGRAFVSLVGFSLEHLRPGRLVPKRLGRALLSPISEHAFLNLRTYVRGPDGPGVLFLAEWINNPISLRLGPLTYGFPFRLAHIERADLPAGGLAQIRVSEPGRDEGIGITVPLTAAEPPRPCGEGTLDAFLIERYTAYTHRAGIDRCFHIAHRPWAVAPVDLVRTDTALLERLYPWFTHASPLSAHIGPGVEDVHIGRPYICGSVRAPSGSPAHAPLRAGAPAITAMEQPSPAAGRFSPACGPAGCGA